MVKLFKGGIIGAVLKKPQGSGILSSNSCECCLSSALGHRPVIWNTAGLAQAHMGEKKPSGSAVMVAG